MKRLAALTVVVLIVAVSGFFAVRSVVSADALRRGITTTLTEWTGRNVTVGAEASVVFSTTISVTVNGLAIKDSADEAPLVRADSLSATVRWWPLLFGRTEFDHITLEAPEFILRREIDGRANWMMPNGAIGRLIAEGEAADDIRLGDLEIVDGSLVYDDVVRGVHVALTGISVNAEWSTALSDIEAAGSLVWRGEQVEFNGTLSDPLRLIAKQTSPLRMAIAATPLRLQFAGTAAIHDAYQLEGTATLTTPSLRSTISWFGVPMEPGAFLGAASLEGELNWFGTTASFADAVLELDGNRSEGALSLEFGEIPGLGGTLAYESLDLSPYVEAAGAMIRGPAGLLGGPTRIALLDGLSTDLRISANEVRIGSETIGPTAASIKTGDGEALLSIGELIVDDGAINGDIALTNQPEGLAVIAEGTLRGIELDGWSEKDGFVRGDIDGDFRVSGTGASWAELLASGTGAGEVSVEDGALNGIALTDAHQVAPSPEEVVLANGRSEFDALHGTLALLGTNVVVDDIELLSGDLKVTGTAWGSLLTGSVGGKLTLAEPDSEAPPVPLTLSGSWTDPTFAVTEPPPTVNEAPPTVAEPEESAVSP